MSVRQYERFDKLDRGSGTIPATNIKHPPSHVAGARRRRGTLRAFGGISLAVGMLSLAGAGYEWIAGSSDAERYPVLGQLVDVDGHRLHIACFGQGSPTVILDAGLGGTSRDWVLIQTQLSASTRVCAYDRAGMGWSDTGPGPRSPARIADELRRLLANADVPAPYVIVAHSLSGKTARLFAAAHPDDVAGMVLVDTRSERVDALTPAAEAEAFNATLERQATLLSLARRIGLVRLFGSRIADRPKLPPGAATEMVLLQTKPKSLNTTTQEGLARSDDDGALMTKSLGAIPLAVIAAGESTAGISGWAEAQEGLVALSTQGRLIVAEDSSHSVQIDQPEIVISAILSVLDAVRGAE